MTLSGLGSVSCDTVLREILDGVDPDELWPGIFGGLFSASTESASTPAFPPSSTIPATFAATSAQASTLIALRRVGLCVFVFFLNSVSGISFVWILQSVSVILLHLWTSNL
ncbi:MAG: hypothetical protein M0O96_10810 [Desulforhopalus sp.]|nr:hypothetical protein [Desulforhopalus sp.]